MFGLLKYLRNRALTRGVLRGQRTWMVIGAVVWGLRALQWAWPKEETVVYRTLLEPGETIEIVHDVRTRGDARRQAKRRRH